MFELFEKISEGIGFRSVSDFTNKVYDWIKEVKKGAENKEDDNNIATSGDWSKVATSGYYSQVATSGNYSKVATSGYRSQVATSGNYSKVATSGNYSKVATSGDYSQVATSGNYSKVATSGNGSQVATSGDYSQVATSGDYSISFACGFRATIKAKKGTWISLAEWEWNKKLERWIPTFALSAQIGNKDYKDFKGRILKETEAYCLYNKQFYPVDVSDGITILKLSEKKRDGITIIKGQDYDKKDMYLVKEKNLCAHGDTLKQALEDLQFKKLKSEEVQDIIKEIKKAGKVNRMQYRAITGACQYGTNKFCEEHNIQELNEISLEELRKILINDYGAEKFWSLIDKE